VTSACAAFKSTRSTPPSQVNPPLLAFDVPVHPDLLLCIPSPPFTPPIRHRRRLLFHIYRVARAAGCGPRARRAGQSDEHRAAADTRHYGAAARERCWICWKQRRSREIARVAGDVGRVGCNYEHTVSCRISLNGGPHTRSRSLPDVTSSRHHLNTTRRKCAFGG
jgi:hypothetical protein